MNQGSNATMWRRCGLFTNQCLQYLHSMQRRWWKAKFYLEAYGSLSEIKRGIGLRFDVPVRVGSGLGSLEIGDSVGFGWPAAPMLGDGTILIEPRSSDSVIEIGSGTIFSNNVSIVSMGGVKIGERCLIGDQTLIFDCDFHELAPAKRMDGVGPIEPVTIGNNVWFGSRTQILRGVSIGDNSVIGAGSVVVHNIPANSVAAGVPAKVIRSL